MQRGNKNQNCSWKNIQSVLSRREPYGIPQTSLHSLLWKRQQRFFFWAVQASHISEVVENFSNNKPYDPHGFKEEIKIKFNAVKAVVEKFPNGTGAMMELLKAEVPALDWAAYCAMSVAQQLVWEKG